MLRIMAVAGLPRLLLSMILTGAALVGCARPVPPTPFPPAAPPPSVPAPPPVAAPGIWAVEEWIDHLTLEEKVGQLFWVGLPGETVSDEARQLLSDGHVGGFVLFARQGADPGQLRALTDSLQSLAQERDRPTPRLLIAADQEGGLVQRFKDPLTTWPGAMALGAVGSEAYAQRAAEGIARELQAIGVNMNLAPVADVNNNPANPVIGIRSFGENPAMVSRLTRAAIRGLQAHQVSAVAKHFPGHGDTDVDSHFALPIVGHTWERLQQVELPPFVNAIAADVGAIMTAHVIFPAVAGDDLPATLSPKVLTGLLKEQLGFKGVVVTDAMEMKAIADNWGVAEGLVLAIQAGADAVLVADSFGKQQEFHSLVVQAVQQGRIPGARLDDAVRRNLALKLKRGLMPDQPQPTERAPLDAKLTGPNQEMALHIGTAALTLVRNQHLPLTLASNQRLLVISPVAALGAGIAAEHSNVQNIALQQRPSPQDIAAARILVDGAAAIVYGVYNGHRFAEHQAFINELIATGKPVIVIGLGEPYELSRIPQIQTYIAAYGFQTPNVQGVGALLFGKVQPTGRLPVSLPGLYPVGHGLVF